MYIVDIISEFMSDNTDPTSFPDLDERFSTILYEATNLNVEKLPDIELAFQQLKNAIGRSYRPNPVIVKRLFDAVNSFCRGRLAEFTIINQPGFYNAYVFPVYQNTFFTTKIFRSDRFDLDVIKSIYIGFTLPLIRELTPRECVAVLLHEFGHVFQYTVNLTKWINIVLRFLAAGDVVPVGLRRMTLMFLVFRKAAIEPTILLISFLALYIFGRTLYFTEHLREYDADKFCTRLGYGEELISVLNKLRQLENPTKSVRTEYISKIKRFLKSLVNFIFHPNPTHPTYENRICNIIKTLNKEYDNHYKIKSKEVEKILKQIEC